MHTYADHGGIRLIDQQQQLVKLVRCESGFGTVAVDHLRAREFRVDGGIAEQQFMLHRACQHGREHLFDLRTVGGPSFEFCRLEKYVWTVSRFMLRSGESPKVGIRYFERVPL